MSRRRGEFEHRTSIFEGAFRAWCFLGQLSPEELFSKEADDFNPLIACDGDGNPLPTVDGRSSAGDDYRYEPLPRTGLAHPFCKAILSPWLGPDVDSEAMDLGLTTLRTWWQHRRRGESGTAINALGTDRMRSVVDGYTQHFFALAHLLIVQEQEQPPRSLQSKIRELEKAGAPGARGFVNNIRKRKSISKPPAPAVMSNMLSNMQPPMPGMDVTNANHLLNPNAAAIAQLNAATATDNIYGQLGLMQQQNALGAANHPSNLLSQHRNSATGLTLGQMHAGQVLQRRSISSLSGHGSAAAAAAAVQSYHNQQHPHLQANPVFPNAAPGAGLYQNAYGSSLGPNNSASDQLAQLQANNAMLNQNLLDQQNRSSFYSQQPNLHNLQQQLQGLDGQHTASRRSSTKSDLLAVGVNPLMAEFASFSQASQRAHRGGDVGKFLRNSLTSGPSRRNSTSNSSCCNKNSASMTKGSPNKSTITSKKGSEKVPIVFVDQDVHIGLQVEGIDEPHNVKMIETVLKGPKNAKKIPINGLLDVVASDKFNFVLIKIDTSSNAKRVAADAIRNLSMIGFEGKVYEMNIQDQNVGTNGAKKNGSVDMSALFGACEAVGSSSNKNVFDWGKPCACFRNGTSINVDCPRRSQLTVDVINAFREREKQIKEYMKGCMMRYGGDCTCEDKCDCAGCPKHNQNGQAVRDPKESSTTSNNIRPIRRRSGRVGGGRFSFTQRGSGISFGRAMSGLSNISIDWDNMEDFDVNVDHSANVVHNNLVITDGCDMLNGGECSCDPDSCKCTGCTKHGNGRDDVSDGNLQHDRMIHPRKRRRSSLRRRDLSSIAKAVTGESTSVSFKL